MPKTFTLLLLLSCVGLAQPPSGIAIRNARIITGAGPILAKGTVVLRNGLIEARVDAYERALSAARLKAGLVEVETMVNDVVRRDKAAVDNAAGDASEVPASGEPTNTTLRTSRFAMRSHQAVTSPLALSFIRFSPPPLRVGRRETVTGRRRGCISPPPTSPSAPV